MMTNNQLSGPDDTLAPRSPGLESQLQEEAAEPLVEKGNPEDSTPPSAGKSRIALWAGLGLLVLALVAAGGYYLGVRQAFPRLIPKPYPIETPSVVPTSSPSTTRAWQRYVNAEDGYEVDYPPGWTVDEDPNTVFESPDKKSDDDGVLVEGIAVVVFVGPNARRINPIQVLQEISYNWPIPPYQEVTVAGSPAIRYFVESSPGILGRAISVIMGRGDKRYDLLAMYDPAREEEASQIVDRMLESWIYR